MASITDDKGYNQGFTLVESTVIRMKRRAELFAREMDLSGTRQVLEIGCGTGEISNWLSEKDCLDVLGTDICQSFITSATKKYVRNNLSFEVMDFNNPDEINGRTFDYIVGNGILHHLYPQLHKCLSTMRDLLNPGGKIIFMEPNIYNPYCALIFNFTRKLAKLEPDEMAFSRRFITNLLREVGYSNAKALYKDFLIPGIPRALIAPSITIGDVLERTPILNRLSQSLYIVADK